MPIVQIEFFAGRTVDQKRALADKVTRAICEALSVPPESVRIILREMKHEDYATAGKLRVDG
ncbi:MAG: 4-oxalocrotonate tautomerase [Bacillota bacterium]